METDTSPTGPRRRALVTGASSGIGEAFAERLAQEKYDLVVVARSGELLEALAKRLGEKRSVEVEVFVADLTRPDDLLALEARIGEEPGFDLVVNNAGAGASGAFVDGDVDRDEQQIRLNVLALVRLSHAALRTMVPRGRGTLINVSSLAAFAPLPYNATYAATKAFVNSFSESLAEELRDSGVRLQVLCPGFTRTNFQQRAGTDVSSVPAFAWMTPEAVVDASLAALAGGPLVCVPGGGYKALSLLYATVPRSLLRRALGRFRPRRDL